MNLSFVIVIETTEEFLNMTELLLFSFRKNAGIYKNCEITLVTMGNSLEKKKIYELSDKFGPLIVKTMPRLGGIPYNNKFNFLYAVDPENTDIIVYLDYDLVILEPLDEITDAFVMDDAHIKALPINPSGCKAAGNYEKLILEYCYNTKNTLSSFKNDQFISLYPLFNTGLILMNSKAVISMREDILNFSYRLYSSKLKSTIPGGYYLNLIFNTVRDYLKGVSTSYKLWNTEQMAFALAMINNNVGYSTFDKKYICSIGRKNRPVVILHFTNLKKIIDLKYLFNGDWQKEFLKSQNPLKSSLAKLVDSYNKEYGHK